MKKPNRRRDILLQTKREKRRLQKHTKMDRSLVHASGQTIAEQSWFWDKFLPRLSFTEKKRDKRKRHSADQRQGDR